MDTPKSSEVKSGVTMYPPTPSMCPCPEKYKSAASLSPVNKSSIKRLSSDFVRTSKTNLVSKFGEPSPFVSIIFANSVASLVQPYNGEEGYLFIPTTSAFLNYYTLLTVYRELIQLEMLSHVQLTIRIPFNSEGSRRGLSSCLPQIALRGISSSRAQFISHSCPSAFMVSRVTITRTPAHPLILVRHLLFHAESHGRLTDKSTNLKGDWTFLAWPTNKSLKFLSSIAKLTKIRRLANPYSPFPVRHISTINPVITYAFIILGSFKAIHRAPDMRSFRLSHFHLYSLSLSSAPLGFLQVRSARPFNKKYGFPSSRAIRSSMLTPIALSVCSPQITIICLARLIRLRAFSCQS